MAGTELKVKTAGCGLAALLMGATALSAPVSAQTTLERTVGAQVIFSDNTNLAPEGLEENEITTLMFGSANGRWERPRFNLTGAGRLEGGYYSDSGDFFLDPNISVNGQATLIRNVLFFDAAASTGRALNNTQSRFSGVGTSARDERSLITSFSGGPRLQLQAGRIGVFRARANRSETLSDGPRSDQSTDTASASFETESFFGGLTLTGAYSYRRTQAGEDAFAATSDLERNSFDLTARYALTNRLALKGLIGDESVKTLAFDESDLGGQYWNAGFEATPSKRTSVEAAFGERFGGDWFEAQAQYRLSQRLTFRLNADRTLETSEQFFADRASNLFIFQDENDAFVFATRDPLILNEDLGQGLALLDTVSGSLIGQFGRNTIVASGSYQERTYENTESLISRVNLSVSRTFSPKLSADLNGFFARNEQTEFFEFSVLDQTCNVNSIVCRSVSREILASNDFDTISGTVSVTYRPVQNLYVTGAYLRTDRISEDRPLLEYKENAFFITMGVDL